MYLPSRSTAASRTAGEVSASRFSKCVLTNACPISLALGYAWRALTMPSTSGSAVMIDVMARSAFDLMATTVEFMDAPTAMRIGSKAHRKA